jgi:4-hydroxythreonine-4-phosphate dehydrogenase
MATTFPRLLITPGEPAGIGPELILQLASQPFAAQLMVIGDTRQLAATATRIGANVKLLPAALEGPRTQHTPGQLQILESPLVNPAVTPGQPQPDNAISLVSAITVAVDSCLAGKADALVTGPVDKAVINRGGITFSGHTELLAELTDTAEVVMLLATDQLRVALLTTHLALREVAPAITPQRLTTALEIIHREMGRLYRLPNPRIAICGLNPHAGDGGYLGDEELRIIEPVLEQLRQQGMRLIGPLPADSAFAPQALGSCDLVLAMYHDQGLPVLKQSSGHEAVNITLGLPILRTSVDHGTAYDLAGSGLASCTSLKQAIHTAIELCQR